MLPIDFYKESLNNHSQTLKKLQSLSKKFSNIRLAIFIVGLAIFFIFFRSAMYSHAAFALFFSVLLFIAAIFKHTAIHKKIQRASLAIKINTRFIKRVDGTWRDLKTDDGEEFKNLTHPYSYDLDIFGKNSLYQWISSCNTHFGKQFLASYLRGEKNRVENTIKFRNDAVVELSGSPCFLEEFQLEAGADIPSKNPEKIIENLENNSLFNLPTPLKYFLLWLPVASFVFSLVPFLVWGTVVPATIFYTLHLVIFTAAIAPCDKILSHFEKSGELFLAYSKMLFMLEKRVFSSPLLQTMQKNLVNSSGENSSFAIKKLRSIIAISEVRYSAIGRLVSNIFGLTDIRCAINAVEWKKRNGKFIRQWINIIGEFEVLSSFASIKYENPKWAFLSVSPTSPAVEMKKGGHPLIHESIRVDNSLEISNFETCAIITGSNMSGKSTFLRTLGVNLVMGYCGGVVCAEKFSAPLMNIYTTMRIQDDLSSSTSTFYAELLRIKTIVDASSRGEMVFFLIDELFRGTNSQDQHEGSVAVLKSLAKENCIGLISTHDLELCSLANKEPQKFVNYHFREYFEKDKLNFDYKINQGPSTTKNALFLIRMAGIKV